MALHKDAFSYLRPTDRQVDMMDELRGGATQYAKLIDIAVPDGPDKTYILRKLREVAMWVNVAITRTTDGSPRSDMFSEGVANDREAGG
jgi:hypothetical protein